MIRNCVLIAAFAWPSLAASRNQWCLSADTYADKSAPTTQQALDHLLEGLDARGRNLSTLEATLAKSEVDLSLGEDTETRTGRIIYDRNADGAVRIRVSLDKLKIGEKIQEARIEYVLLDGVLIDRNYRSKVEMQRIVQKPGQKLDLFKLGQGPFPLPIGQPKEAVYEQFEVSEQPAGQDAPPNTAHLKLVPKPGTELARKFASIDVWVERSDFLPRRIETMNAARTILTRTQLDDVKLNAQLDAKAFALEKVSEKEWNIKIEAD